MKGIYLAAHIADHPNYNIDYQDITGFRDIGGDMLDVDLTPYDFIIATPPCNYWSRANYRRETSEYAQKTKHLLPDIIDKLIKLNKPFIVENVRNFPLFSKNGLYDLNCFIYEYGRHTYWTNILVNFNGIVQENDFLAVNKRVKGRPGYFITPNGNIVKSAGQTLTNLGSKNRQGGENVYKVIEHWLEIITKELENE